MAGRGLVVTASVVLAAVTTFVLGIVISIGNLLPEIVTWTITVVLIVLFAIMLPPALYLMYKIFTLRSIILSSETPFRYRFAVLATGLYLISPFDPVPLILIDDVTLLLLTYRFVKRYADGVGGGPAGVGFVG